MLNYVLLKLKRKSPKIFRYVFTIYVYLMCYGEMKYIPCIVHKWIFARISAVLRQQANVPFYFHLIRLGLLGMLSFVHLQHIYDLRSGILLKQNDLEETKFVLISLRKSMELLGFQIKITFYQLLNSTLFYGSYRKKCRSYSKCIEIEISQSFFN